MNTILTKSELEQLLPDYAFGKSSEDEIRLIELSLPHYPDLQQELTDIHSAFARIDTTELNTQLEQRTRNLSLKVHQRMQAKTYLFSRSFWYQTALPAVALLLGAVTFQYYTQNNSPSANTITSTDSCIEIIRPTDAQLIMNEDVSILAAIEEANRLTTLPDVIPATTTLDVDELLASSLQSSNTDTHVAYTHSDDLWLNLTDSELQDILKDLQYENPSTL